jgi:hypothetical protein
MNKSKSFIEWNKVTPIFKYLVEWVIGILSYEALLEVYIFCFGFLVIGWINFSNNAPTIISLPMLVPVLKWFRFKESYGYDTEDIKSFLSKVIFVLGLVGAVLHFLINKLLKIKLKMSRWYGLGIITMFFMLSLISCYTPTAKNGAQSIVPVLVFFLLFSFISYGRYLFFQQLGKWTSNWKAQEVISHKRQ